MISRNIHSILIHQNYFDVSKYFSSLDLTNVDYRHSFQGQEKDDEIKGEGNSVNYKYRMHDTRIGRFFAVDPLAAKYPHNSPYAFSENKTIAWRELEGLESVGAITFGDEQIYGKRFEAKVEIPGITVQHINVSGQAGQGGTEDFVTALKVLSDSDVNGIGFVAIFSHGQPGSIFANADLNPEADNVYTSELWMIGQADINFADGAMIYLGGCNCGTYGVLGLGTFAQELANQTGVPVIAVQNSKMGRYDSENLIFTPAYSEGVIMIFHPNAPPTIYADGKFVNVIQLAENVMFNMITHREPTNETVQNRTYETNTERTTEIDEPSKAPAKSDDIGAPTIIQRIQNNSVKH